MDQIMLIFSTLVLVTSIASQSAASIINTVTQDVSAVSGVVSSFAPPDSQTANVGNEVSQVASDAGSVASSIANVATAASTTAKQAAFCWKSSYSRGIGKIPHNHQCPEDHPVKQLGLCYRPCKPSYKGILTQCRFQCSSIGMVGCGFGCAVNPGVCAQVVTSQIGDVVGSVVKSVATMSPKVDLKDFQAGKCMSLDQ